ncbi:MAG: hypothetical protein JO307_26160, partial [Bryobacterales bacterium]|nr:hypothetical protein [Bryobacterales bacterium]
QFYSTLNALDGVIASNMALVPAASGGITAYASDSTDLILDLFGYFAPPPPPPTVQLTDVTQSGPYYFVGDSFTLTVTGAPNQPVAVIQNSVASGVLGYTNSSGVYSVSSTWSAGNAGGYTQVWTVGGIPTTVLAFEIIPADPGGPASISSFTAPSPTVPCTDITGNWIATPDYGPQSEWDLTQSGTTVTGTAYASWNAQCLTATYTVSGTFVSSRSNPNGSFTLNATNPSVTNDGCGNQFLTSDSHTVSLSGSSCSTGSGTYVTSDGTYGVLCQQSKTTPNVVTSNRTTAHYKIDYASYIPVDHVAGPTLCLTTDQYGNQTGHLLIYIRAMRFAAARCSALATGRNSLLSPFRARLTPRIPSRTPGPRETTAMDHRPTAQPWIPRR